MPIDVTQLPIDDGAEIQRVLRRYYPLLLRQAWEEAGQQVGLTTAFDLDNPFVQEVLDTLAMRVTRIAETTRDEIRALVGKQAEEGWSIDQLAQAIREHGQQMSESRSILIARTETADAYSRGSILAYEDAGVEEIAWLTTADDKTCPICQPLNGKQVRIGDAFADGILHPAAHPGCRCSLVPVVRR